MKKLLIQLFLVILPLTLNSQEKGIQFENGTFAEALAKAKKENKNLFLDCYTLWCGPCRFMANNVLNTDSVGEYMNPRFVSIKMDMERGEGVELAEKLNVKAFPTFIVFNPNGKELGRFEGGANVSQFIQYVEMATEGKDVKAFQEEERERISGTTNQWRDEPQEIDTIYDEGRGLKLLDITYEQALAKAKAENKRVFIDCYASWCAPCKKMDSTTFRDTRIGNLMNYQFINIKIDLDDEIDGRLLTEQFNVNAFPTYILVNPDGTEFNRFSGSGPVLHFAESLTKALMGEEDPISQMLRLEKEALEKARTDRKSNLAKTPKSFKPSLVKFEKESEIEKAVKKAKKQNKNVFIMLYAENWQSDYMVETIFNEKEAADYLNEKFVNLLVDAESIQGDNIMDIYHLKEFFPGFIILDGEGEIKVITYGHKRSGNLFIEDLEQLLTHKI